MATAKVNEIVNADADKLFAILGDFAGIKSEFITAIKVLGSGIGCVRELTLTDGARAVDRLDNHDANSRTMTYSLQNDDHPLPFTAYVSTVMVTPMGPNQCRVDWFANFEPKGATAAEAITFAQGIYSGMIKDAQMRLAAP